MSRPGFATFMAVVLLAALGISLAALATMVRIDARRTRDAAHQAQLRQLLLAGERVAASQLADAKAPPVGDFKVALPAEAGDHALMLTFQAGGADTDLAIAHVIATGDATTARQQLTWRQTPNGAWRLEAADLLQQR
jgi:Tfp pilus assembly protein PilV